jgi:hypothetical protein
MLRVPDRSRYGCANFDMACASLSALSACQIALAAHYFSCFSQILAKSFYDDLARVSCASFMYENLGQGLVKVLVTRFCADPHQTL